MRSLPTRTPRARRERRRQTEHLQVLSLLGTVLSETRATQDLLVQLTQALREPLPLVLNSPPPGHQELKELLLEVLQSTQPSAEAAVARSLGLLTQLP